uniref:Uncharacterized protein n=1 Tax=Erpetoichthys calabaricus TaxID=27687 RepID=A0A8C4SXC1_ERPCA
MKKMMHNLLDLIKTEQNIYNIIFHELIRQVSVECAERGELLAKLRSVSIILMFICGMQEYKRYVMLLDRVPRHLKALYMETLAQREANVFHGFYFLGGTINYEDVCHLYSLVAEYHELYELQRRRLEAQVSRLTEERDLWSRVTYSLALKDTEDLNKVIQLVDKWKDLVYQCNRELEQAWDSGREKIKLIEADITKWHAHFNEGYQRGPEFMLLQDLKQWEEMLTVESTRYGGEELLSNQENVKTMAQLQQEWNDILLTVLGRHPNVEQENTSVRETMKEITKVVQDLHQELGIQITGENGKIFDGTNVDCTVDDGHLKDVVRVSA